MSATAAKRGTRKGTLRLKIGTEHELSINDGGFRPLPVNDAIIESIWGTIPNEIPLGGISLSKELQKHALEVKPIRPHVDLPSMERKLHHGVLDLYARFGQRYRFLGMGMHPTLTLDQTTYWDHEEREVYEAYDRLFGIRQHGWLNIQALQINIPYLGNDDFVTKHNRLRALLPYLIALTAASPIVEGKVNGHVDQRLDFYMANQGGMPSICHRVIPERLSGIDEYNAIQEGIYRELRERNATVLCNEWVNSRGIITRFWRSCLEIKALDEQESMRADMAITAFIRALVLAPHTGLEEDHGALVGLMEEAIRGGTANLRPELQRLYKVAERWMYNDDRRYLPIIRRRIEYGSLGELVRDAFRDGQPIHSILEDLEGCLKENTVYGGKG